MQHKPPDHQQLGQYYALAQVGFEMVAPLVGGLMVDYFFGIMPWGAVLGAVIGFVGGVAHLVFLMNRDNDRDSPHSQQDGP